MYLMPFIREITTADTAQATLFDRLVPESYLALTTHRRDGTPVTTPIWAASYAGRMYACTPARTGRARRIRNDGRVTLAPCDRRGPCRGEDASGQAAVLAADRIGEVRAIMRAKYGWQFRLFSRIIAPLLARTSRFGGAPVGIEIRPAD